MGLRLPVGGDGLEASCDRSRDERRTFGCPSGLDGPGGRQTGQGRTMFIASGGPPLRVAFSGILTKAVQLSSAF